MDAKLCCIILMKHTRRKHNAEKMIVVVFILTELLVCFLCTIYFSHKLIFTTFPITASYANEDVKDHRTSNSKASEPLIPMYSQGFV